MSRAVRQVAFLVAAAMLAVAGASCSAQTGRNGRAGSEQQIRTGASRPPQGDPARLAPRPSSDASCPVTVPLDAAAVPPVVARAGGDWYGKDDLWVSLWFTRPDPGNFGRQDGFYYLKYGSVTLDDDGKFTSRFGPPAIQARRLDGPGTARAGSGGYGYTSSLRFWPTGIEFSDPGCWLVTTSFRRTVLRFVVKVI